MSVNSDCGFWIVNCSSKLQGNSSARPFRNALTLVELLITITIMATLAGLFLGASSSAMESARRARTKSTINKIHTLLMERWDEYTTRRVDVDASGLTGSTAAGRRLVALRRLMQLEMPDRWDDILDQNGGTLRTVENFTPADAKTTTPPVNATVFADPNATIVYPAITKAYWRRYAGLSSSASPNAISDNQGAECLYMIVMLFTGDGEARTLFSRQDIGDTDEDGAPEFLDGWGRPIHFIRWPAGFVAESSLMTGDAQVEPDTFDHFRVDQLGTSPASPYLNDGFPAFRMLPLIYSGGSDGDPDLYTAKGPLIDDPYREYQADSITARIGTPMSYGSSPDDIDPDDDGDNWLDNIHNHLLDGR